MKTAPIEAKCRLADAVVARATFSGLAYLDTCYTPEYAALVNAERETLVTLLRLLNTEPLSSPACVEAEDEAIRRLMQQRDHTERLAQTRLAEWETEKRLHDLTRLKLMALERQVAEAATKEIKL